VKKSKVTSKQWKALLKKSNTTNEKGDIWYPSEGSRRGAEACYDFNVPDRITTDEEWESIKRWLRPTLLNFIDCDTILLKDVTFKNSPAWCLHPLMCTHLTIDAVQVSNPWYAQNGDALDIESCKNVMVINSTFDAGDDAICIKSGKDEDGRRRAIPCENVIIRNNTVLHGHGGFVVGSEMSGGVEDVFIWDCDFTAGRAGIGLKVTPKRGGYIRGVRVRSSRFVNLRARSVTFNDDGEPSGEMSRVSDVLFEKVTMTGISRHPDGKLTPTEALYIAGLDGEENHFSRFTFRDLRLPVLADCQRICIRNVKDLTLSGISFFEDKE
jgi:polygalacturonase